MQGLWWRVLLSSCMLGHVTGFSALPSTGSLSLRASSRMLGEKPTVGSGSRIKGIFQPRSQRRALPLQLTMSGDGNKAPVYLDHERATPVASSVLGAMQESFEHWGDASLESSYFGKKSAEIMEFAKTNVAAAIGGTAGEIFFTSGIPILMSLLPAYAG
eukprot:3823784-Rhodomonas_salina.2